MYLEGLTDFYQSYGYLKDVIQKEEKMIPLTNIA